MPSQVTGVASDDALTTIYRLAHDEGAQVIAARVAERLEVSAPSMAAMLQRLSRDGLVKVDGARQVTLTPSGLERAETMIRRHRLAECFLIQVLGLEWWRAYDEAHLMEHAITSITEPLFQDLLGHPHESPFGYPLPGLTPKCQISRRTVIEMATGETATVQRVFEEDAELLRYFWSTGIRPGVEVRKASSSNALGTATLVVGGSEVVVALPVAARIWVADPAAAAAAGPKRGARAHTSR